MNAETYAVIAQLQAIADATGDGIPAFNRETGGITLYWFGPVPSTVTEITAEHADT